MKRAIVLSGGGARGAYQMGFWKAIRELGVDYHIVTGTSIGALNGIFMVQNNYHKAYKMWYFMDYDMVLDDKVDATYETLPGKRKIIMKYTKGAMKGGLSVSALEKTVKIAFNPRLFFSSKVDYGLITVKFPSLKPIMVTKDKLKKENAVDYFLASAACFPAFKMKDIDTQKYIDGGFYDNLPINLAIKMGADEVIAVDLKAVGNVKKVKNKDIKITTISPRNDIGNFLVMEKYQARRAIKYGYNDTMKTFKVLDGDKYTFKRGSLARNYKRNEKAFYNNISLFIKNPKQRYKKLYSNDKLLEFSKILEQLAKAFDIDETIIYRASFLNVLIKKKYKKEHNFSFRKLNKMMKDGSLKKHFVSMELICYIYKEMIKGKKNVSSLAILFPNSFLCAVYLKSIMKN